MSASLSKFPTTLWCIRAQVITLADQPAIAAEDEFGQAGDAAVLFQCLLYPVKELSV